MIRQSYSSDPTKLLKLAALGMIVGTCLMVLSALMVGMGKHTGFVIAVGAIVVASCVAVIAIAGRKSVR